MKKSTKISLVGMLLVGLATASNEVALNTRNPNRTIPIVTTPNLFKGIKLAGLPEIKFPEKEIQQPQENYKEFKYPDELPQILKHAKTIDIEPELLIAIRLAENGKDSLAYGIISNGKRYDNDKGYTLEGKFYPYTDEKEKQLYWAASTVKKNIERFEANPRGYKDFISYLANRYAPIGVKNDPTGLNNHWEKNVRFFYKKFKYPNP